MSEVAPIDMRISRYDGDHCWVSMYQEQMVVIRPSKSSPVFDVRSQRMVYPPPDRYLVECNGTITAEQINRAIDKMELSKLRSEVGACTT